MRDEDLPPLRRSVALASPRSAYLRIAGDAAFDVVDRLVTNDLYLQEAQLRQSLMLDDDGLIVADAIVGRDDDAYLLVLDGPSREESRWLVATQLEGTGCTLEALHETHDVLGLHGPFAWELLGEWLGPDLVGISYLTSFRAGDVLVLRTGRTGEFGYDVVMPRERAEELRTNLATRGAVFDLTPVTQAELDLAALENGFFNIDKEGALCRDPLELQLKWRLSKEKAHRGSERLRARWQTGARRRATWIVSDRHLAEHDTITLDGEPIGAVVNAGFSALRGAHVGIALLDCAFAHAGVDAFERDRNGVRANIRTVPPPLLNNRSLHVSPQRHSYRDRATIVLPTP